VVGGNLWAKGVLMLHLGIFSDIQTIFTFNESLLKRIEERVGNWSQHQKLGDIFVDIVFIITLLFLFIYPFEIGRFLESLHKLRTKL
jgi:hypothetical protein